MKELIELNCIGMKCPRPITEIAKIAHKLPESTIKIPNDEK